MKTNTSTQTKRRFAILEEISRFISKKHLPVKSSRVGGSLAFARNFAITKQSDIDLDVFVPFKKVHNINPLLELLHAERVFAEDEDWGNFDQLASYGEYKGVEIYIWIFNADTFEKIACFEKDYLRYFSLYKPSKSKKYSVFGGGRCEIDKKVEKYLDGYSSRRYILHNDDLISENYILNNLFFVFPIYGKSYSDRMVNIMWDAFLTRYPNATEKQILDFIPKKVRERFSPEFHDDFQRRVRDRLKKLHSNIF